MALLPGDVKVTNITNVAKVGPTGSPERYKNIQFTIRGKTVDSIEVPLAEYNADTVMRLVIDRAEQTAKILDMGQ